jgi:hypothetical protein
VLLSRPEAFDRVGSDAVGSAETVVLQVMADLAAPDEAPDEAVEPEPDRCLWGGVPRGLHAKVFVWDEGDSSHVLTGSANCTAAAFGGNIEMSVLLSGRTADCGVDVLIGDDKAGLLRITQPYQIATAEPVADPSYELDRRVEEWQAAIAATRPVLRVTPVGEEFDLRLEVALPPDPHGLASSTVVKPVAVTHAPFRPVIEHATWTGVSFLGLSPYLVVSTETHLDGTAVQRACVLLCELDGVPEDRQRRLLRDLLARQQDVLRYLMLLLGDIGAADLLDRLADNDEIPDDPQRGRSFGAGFDDLVLLEPRRAPAARGDDSLERAHRLLEDLRDEHGDLPQLDEDFQRLWQVIYDGGRS